MELPCFVDIHNQYIYINSERDLCDIIEKYCGHEVSMSVADICDKADAAKVYAEQKIYSDLDAYEDDLYNWESVGRSIEEELSGYEEYDACHKNLNRERIDQMKKRIRTLLDNVM